MTPLLTCEEAAKLLQVAPCTLARWREERRGVPFLRFNRKVVRYRLSDLGHTEEPARDVLIDAFEVAYVLRLSRQVIDACRTGSRCNLPGSSPPFIGELCNELALLDWINAHKEKPRLLADKRGLET